MSLFLYNGAVKIAAYGSDLAHEGLTCSLQAPAWQLFSLVTPAVATARVPGAGQHNTRGPSEPAAHMWQWGALPCLHSDEVHLATEQVGFHTACAMGRLYWSQLGVLWRQCNVQTLWYVACTVCRPGPMTSAACGPQLLQHWTALLFNVIIS